MIKESRSKRNYMYKESEERRRDVLSDLRSFQYMGGGMRDKTEKVKRRS